MLSCCAPRYPGYGYRGDNFLLLFPRLRIVFTLRVSTGRVRTQGIEVSYERARACNGDGIENAGEDLTTGRTLHRLSFVGRRGRE